MCSNEPRVADGPGGRPREELFEKYRSLARSVARRICRRTDEDVEQVAYLGLIKAIDRFDAELGTGFPAYAALTIRGEVLHYLRDQTGLVRMPRWAYEMAQAAHGTTVELMVRRGRPPRLDEVAASLGVDLDRLSEALIAKEACVSCSINAFTDGANGDPPGSGLAADDQEMARAEGRVAVTQLLSHLDRSLRNVIRLRYYEGLSQRETALRCGVSAVQICRLEHRALDELRALWTHMPGELCYSVAALLAGSFGEAVRRPRPGE